MVVELAGELAVVVVVVLVDFVVASDFVVAGEDLVVVGDGDVFAEV